MLNLLMLRFFTLIWLMPLALLAREVQTDFGRVDITEIARGFDEPWSLGFFPDGDFIVTERVGRLTYFDDGQALPIAGVPASQQGGQAGLFDVLVPSTYARDGKILLSYADPEGRGTAVVEVVLNVGEARLEAPKVIFVMNSPSRSDRHFGGRLVEASPSQVYLTLGERGDGPLAQDMRVDNGAVMLINRDGSGAARLSKGHRNPQGAALDGRGALYVVEHGAQGGDEINAIVEGANYGWPVISYGRDYDDSQIGEGTSKAGMEQPLFYWDPSIAPSGLEIHSGRGWPEMKGNFIVGSLKFDEIVVAKPGENFDQIGAITSDETARVRDVREAPDGAIWFLSVNNGALYRISPLR